MSEGPPTESELAHLRDQLNDRVTLRDSPGASAALIELVFADSDWRWLEAKCLELLDARDADLRGAAISGLGHIARIHGRLHRERVQETLKALADNEPDFAGRIEDALSDFDVFL